MLTGIDLTELDLERACNVVYASWVGDFGPMADPVKAREAINGLLGNLERDTRSMRDPDTWGTDERAQAGQNAFMELAGKSRRGVTPSP